MSVENVTDPSKDELELLFIAEKQWAKTLPEEGDHFEIATCRTLCNSAEALGYDDALKLLKQNLDQEEPAKKNLTMLSGTINKDAMNSNGEMATNSVENMSVATSTKEAAETDSDDKG